MQLNVDHGIDNIDVRVAYALASQVLQGSKYASLLRTLRGLAPLVHFMGVLSEAHWRG